MSVHRKKNSPFWHFDFWISGNRFFGSTKSKNKREAEGIERSEREKAKQHLAQTKTASTSLRLDDVSGRYWTEVGQHHAGKDNTWRDIARLVKYFGKDKLLTEIGGDDVAKLVAWRRGHRVIRKKGADPSDCPLISNATVNRSTTEVLKKLFTRAKRAWKVRLDNEPAWKEYALKESEEHVRELIGDEGERLDDAIRDDYLPFLRFTAASGLRLRGCVFLRWSEVHWDTGQIQITGKGGKPETVPIASEIRAILWPLRAHDKERVFTYVAVRTRQGRVKGQRYPLTYNGAKTTWKRARKKAGVIGFRYHDYRHDIGTKVLRKTGNLKLVQKTLNHRNIKTTLRYAHVYDADVVAALDQLSESRTQSRTRPRKAS